MVQCYLSFNEHYKTMKTFFAKKILSDVSNLICVCHESALFYWSVGVTNRFIEDDIRNFNLTIAVSSRKSVERFLLLS